MIWKNAIKHKHSVGVHFHDDPKEEGDTVDAIVSAIVSGVHLPEYLLGGEVVAYLVLAPAVLLGEVVVQRGSEHAAQHGVGVVEEERSVHRDLLAIHTECHPVAHFGPDHIGHGQGQPSASRARHGRRQRSSHCKHNNVLSNKTPAMHRDIFRLQLTNNRRLIENLPP